MPKDDQAELFVWVDENDKELSLITRREAHDGSRKIHRAVTVVIFNQDKSKLLFQQRSLNKDTNPGRWSCGVGGHLNQGESYQHAAKRELYEELGITWDEFNSKIKFLDEETAIEREFLMVFEISIPDTLTLNLDLTEVQTIQWCNISKIKDFINTHPIVPDTIKILSFFRLS